VFDVTGIPTAFLIGPDGLIVWKGHPNRDTDFETQIDSAGLRVVHATGPTEHEARSNHEN